MGRSLTSAAVIATLTVAACFGSAVAQSDRYPSKSVRLLIPVPPGGGTDFLGRLLGQKLTDSISTSLVT